MEFLLGKGYLDPGEADEFRAIMHRIWPTVPAPAKASSKIAQSEDVSSRQLPWFIGKEIFEKSRILWGEYRLEAKPFESSPSERPQLLEKGSGVVAADAIVTITFSLVGGGLIGVGAGALASIIFNEEVGEESG